MAITLDELLGRNTTTTQDSVERFPSFEEFKSSRGGNVQQNVEQNNTRYNFDMRPYQAPRSEETLRAYEAQRPYVAPQANEYQKRDFDAYDNIRARRQQPVQYQMKESDYVGRYDDTAYIVRDNAQSSRVNSLYEFTAQDNDRLSERELYGKLSHTDDSRRPIFDREESAQVVNQKSGIFARNVQNTESHVGEKSKARLNTKGKIILGVYLAVIALVAVLIIVNASKINHGKAVTPTSGVQDYVVADASNANNLGSYQIDSRYEIRI